MHEDRGHEARFQSRHEHGHADVRFTRTEIDIGKRDGDAGKDKQRESDHEIAPHVLMHAMRVLFVLFRILRDVGRVVHGSEQIKKWGRSLVGLFGSAKTGSTAISYSLMF